MLEYCARHLRVSPSRSCLEEAVCVALAFVAGLGTGLLTGLFGYGGAGRIREAGGGAGSDRKVARRLKESEQLEREIHVEGGKMTEQRERNRQSQQQSGGLQSGRGSTRIEDNVVARIAGIAAQEIDGVRMGSGGAAGAVGNLIGNVPGVSGQTRGVSVEVGQEETAVDLKMTTEYGKPIPQLAEAVRRNVISRIESLVGLKVKEVNIEVDDIYFPGEDEGEEDRRQVER